MGVKQHVTAITHDLAIVSIYYLKMLPRFFVREARGKPVGAMMLEPGPCTPTMIPLGVRPIDQPHFEIPASHAVDQKGLFA